MFPTHLPPRPACGGAWTTRAKPQETFTPERSSRRAGTPATFKAVSGTSPAPRITDERCRRTGLGRPESVFKLVGPTQVAKGSLAGMRVLHHLRLEVPRLCVWPFDRLSRSRSAIVAVEVYPGAFVGMSSAAKGKVCDMHTLNRVLEFHGSASLRKRVLEDRARDADDKADALIAAAALRRLSGDGTVWNPPGLSAARRWQEGWIFGVT